MVALAFGIGFFGLGWQDYVTYRDIESWPSTAGEIVESRMTTFEKGGTVYSPSISYRYEVDGRHFRSDLIATGASGLNHVASRAEAVLDRYPEGSKVDVFYLPSNPQIAYLEPAWQGQGLDFMLIGGLWSLVMAYLIVRILIRGVEA